MDIFQAIQDTRLELGLLSEELGGTITLAATHGVQLFYLPEVITLFRAKHPAVRFTLISLDRGGIMDAVRAATVDLGIVPPITPQPGLEMIPLFSTQPVLITPLDNPLAGAGPPGLESIAGQPFVAFSGDTGLGREVNELFKTRGAGSPGGAGPEQH